MIYAGSIVFHQYLVEAIVDLIDMIEFICLAWALKNPADDSTPDMEYFTLTQGYDLSIPLYNIYLY